MFNSCESCKLNKDVFRLSDLKIGEEAKIFFIAGSDEFKRKVMELGFTKNTKVKILKVSPLGDPISVTIREYELIIKLKDAELILVNKL